MRFISPSAVGFWSLQPINSNNQCDVTAELGRDVHKRHVIRLLPPQRTARSVCYKRALEGFPAHREASERAGA